MRNPGGYDRRITIQQHDGTTDSLGEIDPSPEHWDDYYDTYARLQTRGGKEFFKADQVDGEISTVVEIPWTRAAATITRNMRAVCGSRQLNIAAVIDVDDQHEKINLHCTEDT